VDVWIPDLKLGFEFQVWDGCSIESMTNAFLQDEHHYMTIWYNQSSLNEYPFDTCKQLLNTDKSLFMNSYDRKTYKTVDEMKATMMEDKKVNLIAIPFWWENEER
jgi:hypothetical protein